MLAGADAHVATGGWLHGAAEGVTPLLQVGRTIKHCRPRFLVSVAAPVHSLERKCSLRRRVPRRRGSGSSLQALACLHTPARSSACLQINKSALYCCKSTLQLMPLNSESKAALSCHILDSVCHNFSIVFSQKTRAPDAQSSAWLSAAPASSSLAHKWRVRHCQTY